MSSTAYELPRYGVALDSLGAWLETQAPGACTLIETPTGMIAMLSGSGGEPARQQFAFDFEALYRPVSETPGQSRVAWNGVVGRIGWRRFLAALGAELEHIGATALLLDELDDGLLVAYSYVDPGHGYLWRRRTVTLTPEEMQRMLHPALQPRSGLLDGVLRRG